MTKTQEVEHILRQVAKCEVELRAIINLCEVHRSSEWQIECSNKWCQVARFAMTPDKE